MTIQSLESEMDSVSIRIKQAYTEAHTRLGGSDASTVEERWALEAEIIEEAKAIFLSQVDRYVEERELLAEAEVRYQMHKSAPPVSNRKWVDYDHFINNIWTNWAISNRAMIGANGKAQFKALRQQVKGGES